MEKLDNTFILDLEEKRWYVKYPLRFMTRFFKLVNPGIPILKLLSKDNMLKGQTTSVEQGINIYHLLCQVIQANVPGDVVEVGCYQGITSILMQKTLDQHSSEKRLHVYDSFAGIPKPTAEDGRTIFFEGVLKTTKDRLIENFQAMDARLPEIHEGWFSETLPTQLPEQVAFAHLDGDLYSSIMDSLEYVYPKLAKGGICVIDDYCDPEVLNVNNILPGVKRACDEYLSDKPEKVNVLIAGTESHGYIRKE